MARKDSLHTDATGSDRPSLKDLYDHVVPNVADKWEDLGVQLLRPDQEKMLDVIAADRSHDVVSCCKRVLKKWLDTSTNATWNELIRVLRRPSVELDCLANQLEQMLSIKPTVTAEDTESPPCEKLTNIQDIEIEFAIMTNRIKQALISNKVDVVSLIEQLCAISAVKDKHVPLFDKDVFEKITSIDEFWRTLRIFWNIFDYEVLQCVVKISECREAQQIFEDFLSRIDPSAIEDADLMLDCRVEYREGSPKPVLRIKVNAEKCTFDIIKMVKRKVSKSFKLHEYTLRFQAIKKGYIELCFYISKPLKLYLLQFDISKNILADFLAHKILSLQIDDHNLKTSTDITNETVTWCVQQEEDKIASGQDGNTAVSSTSTKPSTTAAQPHPPQTKTSVSSPSSVVKTPVTKLQEYCQQNNAPLPVYKALQVPAGFQYTVTVGDREYTGEIKGGKQDAKHSAAEVAFKNLNSSRLVNRSASSVSSVKDLKEKYFDKNKIAFKKDSCFSTTEIDGGYRCTLRIGDNVFTSGTCQSKTDAENGAANKALIHFKL